MEKKNKIKFFFNRLNYYLSGEKFFKKINYNFPKNVSRLDLIQKIIYKNNYKSYLEIGCDDNKIFDKIKISDKIGVDPVSGGNFRGTSDNFFLLNNRYFDCIFIDGLHVYEQVKKDILNSIKWLNPSGTIILHDTLPNSSSSQAVPRFRSLWNGDVWKAVVEARTWKDIDCVTVKIDQGVSVIKKKPNKYILDIKVKNFKKLKFKDFYNNYDNYMRIINFKDLDRYI